MGTTFSIFTYIHRYWWVLGWESQLFQTCHLWKHTKGIQLQMCYRICWKWIHVWRSVLQSYCINTSTVRPEPYIVMLFVCWLFYSAIVQNISPLFCKMSPFSFNMYHYHDSNIFIHTITMKLITFNDHWFRINCIRDQCLACAVAMLLKYSSYHDCLSVYYLLLYFLLKPATCALDYCIVKLYLLFPKNNAAWACMLIWLRPIHFKINGIMCFEKYLQSDSWLSWYRYTLSEWNLYNVMWIHSFKPGNHWNKYCCCVCGVYSSGESGYDWSVQIS